MGMLNRKLIIFITLFFFGICSLLYSQADISGVVTTDVTSSGFAVIWQASEPAVPGIFVYADEPGTVDITENFEIIRQPVKSGLPSITDHFLADEDMLSLAQTALDQGLMRIEVRGCSPSTTYYYVVSVTTDTEIVTWPAAGTVAVTTNTKNAFLSDSRQILLTIDDQGGTIDARGWIVMASAAGTTHPVSVFVEDGADENQAFIDLGQLFDVSGSSWTPAATTDILLEIRGYSGGTVFHTVPVAFTGDYSVAATEEVSIDILNYLDSDSDGLSNILEDSGCTDSYDADSDDDGIADGDEDANRNGIVDAGETNPCDIDSDNDGIQDGTELGITVGVADPDGNGPLLGTDVNVFQPDLDPLTTTDPLDDDSDDDTFIDGDEDFNKNGRIDPGESDPNEPGSTPVPGDVVLTDQPVWSTDTSPTWTWEIPAGTTDFLGFYYRLDSETEVFTTDTTFTASDLSDGLHTFMVKVALDTLPETTGPENIDEFGIDTTPPVITDVILNDDDIWTDDTTVTLQIVIDDGGVNGSGLGTIEAAVDGGGFSVVSGTTVTVTDTFGTHNVTVRCTDLVGNLSSEVTSNDIYLSHVLGVTNTSLVADYGNVNISWQNPNGLSPDTLVTRDSVEFPQLPTDGDIVYDGPLSAWKDEVGAGGIWYYSLFAYDAVDDYSPPVTLSVFIPQWHNKQQFTLSSADTVQVSSDTLFTDSDSETLAIGKDRTGAENSCFIFFDDLTSWLETYSLEAGYLDRAKMVFSISSFAGALTEEVKYKLYRITDPDGLGMPVYSGYDGIRKGLDYLYRDHRPGMNVPWKNGAGSVIDLVEECSDSITCVPANYETHGITTLQFDITADLVAMLSGEESQGWFLVAEVDDGESLVTLYGNDPGVIEFAPYIELLYSDNIEAPVVPSADPVHIIPGDGVNTIVWSRDSGDTAGTKIIRTAGKMPFDAYDGDLVYDGTAVSWNDTGLINGESYYYGIFTYNYLRDYSAGIFIKAIPGTPEAPELDTPVVYTSGVKLSFSAVTGADAYRIYRETDADGIVLLDEITDTFFTDTTPDADTYTYWVVSLNSYGESPRSNTEIVVIQSVARTMTPPSSLISADTGNLSIGLSWTDNSDNEAGFTIERRISGETWGEAGRTDFDQTTYIDTVDDPDSTYEYRVAAYAGTSVSGYSNVSTIYIPDYPVPPYNVSWQVISASQVNLSWELISQTLTGQQIVIFDENDTLLEQIPIDTTVTSYRVYRLAPGIEYRFRIVVTNALGETYEETPLIETQANPNNVLF